MVRLAFVFYSLMLLVALGITRLSGRWEHWFPARSAGGYGLDLLLALLTASVFVGVSRVLGEKIQSFKRVTEDFRLHFQGASTLDVCCLALFSGLAEEALFRVALQPLLGLTLASLLFGLLHIKRETLPPPPKSASPAPDPREVPTLLRLEQAETASASIGEEVFHLEKMEPHFLWAWTFFAIVFGLVVGGLFQWRSGLFLPALTHILINGFNLHWLARQP